MSELGWVGKKVRHWSGREGVICREEIMGNYAFCQVGLVIRGIPGTQGGYVQLNAPGPDSGDLGWQWWCEDFDGGGQWIPLGDHNKKTNLEGGDR